jgi:sugar lactone lactonase YvrE
MKHPGLTVITDHKCMLGEGPVWDPHQQHILWVDILKGEVHQYHPGTGRHSIFSAGEMIGCIALRERGGLIAALQSGFAFLDLESETVEHIIDPEAHRPDNRFNDGKCDPEGRFWAGSMSLIDKRYAGGLYVLDRDGRARQQLNGISISNGLAWSLDGRSFYYIDTPTFEVAVYDYQPATAVISNRRVAIRIPQEYGEPDGMTIDSEGMLWIAHWDGWQLTRWDPVRGSLLQRIELPVSRVTSVTFGGEEYQDLYITTARTGLSQAQLADQPLAGASFVIPDCGFTGLAPAEYAG